MKTRVIASLLLGLVLLPVAALAQPGKPSARPQMPARHALAEALLPDGTVKKGIHGQFDPRGWEMRTKANGEPYFVGVPGAALADENWDPSFSTPWPDQPYVYTIAVHGTDVYVGGSFSTVGTTVANNIARWDGAEWHALGAGVRGTVHSLAPYGQSLIVGGSFDAAGAGPATNIAVWDGDSWSALGQGITWPETGGPLVYALAVHGSSVYVGGSFSRAGGLPVDNLARYDFAAATWSQVAGGVRMDDPAVPAAVHALAVWRDQLLVGGNFTVAGGASASNFASYLLADGKWRRLGKGMDDWVTSFATDGRYVYAGGFFKKAGNTVVNGIARWNGHHWQALGEGLATPGSNPMVRDISVVGGYVYAVGYFDGSLPRRATEIVRSRSIMRWNGREWEPLPDLVYRTSGLPDPAYEWAATMFAMGVDGQGGIYVAGGFNQAGANTVMHVAHFEPDSWQPWKKLSGPGVHQGVSAGGVVHAVAVDGNDVYIGGGGMWLGDQWVNGIAKWDGNSNSWMPLSDSSGGDGVIGSVFAIALHGGSVYVGGDFSLAGCSLQCSTLAPLVARYDGAEWHALDEGLGITSSADHVRALAFDPHGNLYAGGYFTVSGAGTRSANSIAMWNGSRWSALGTQNSNGVDGFVWAIAADESGVYVGGNFSQAAGIPANNIARWDGSAWSPLLSPDGATNGVFGTVTALARDSGSLYVGGEFVWIGDLEVNNIAKWTGIGWEALGEGLLPGPGSFSSSAVYGLRSRNGLLYVTGMFRQAGGQPVNNVAVWDGSAWSTLGSGLNDAGSAVDAGDSGVWLAGPFTAAGNKPSVKIAHWSE